MIKAIIFDYYGVLQQDEYVTWLNDHNIARTSELDNLARAYDHREITRDEHDQRLRNIVGFPVTYSDIYKATPPSASNDMIELVRKLHANYALGLLSNAAADLRPHLEKLHILDLFDEILISSELGIAKPQAGIYQLMLTSLQVAPHEAIYIDDNPAYVNAAHSLGIESIVFTSKKEILQELLRYGIS